MPATTRFDAIVKTARTELKDCLLFQFGLGEVITQTQLKILDEAINEIRQYCQTVDMTEEHRSENRQIALERQLEEACARAPYRSAFHIKQERVINSVIPAYRVHRRDLKDGETMERGKAGKHLATFQSRDEAVEYIQTLTHECKEYMIFE